MGGKQQIPASGSSADEVVEVTNLSGAGDFFLVCEHASNFIPPEFDNLGLDGDALQSHIAWDPGAYGVASAMSATLDAPLIASRVSRLVYDCNRSAEAQSAVSEISETYEIPGNRGLSDADRRRRSDRYYAPFHKALMSAIDGRTKAGRPPVIITIHSFAPIYDGAKRDLDIGVIHDQDSRFADEFLRIAETDSRFVTLRNEPYGPDDGVTHTLKEHAMPRGLLNVMIEIRNDLIATPTDQRALAEQLTVYATGALAGTPHDSKALDDSCSKTEPDPIYSTVRRRNDFMFGSVVLGIG